MMCGITGFWDFKNEVHESDLFVMANTLNYRGPDGAGSFFSQSDGIGLGHRRLAIIDLSSSGRQPMANEDGSLWISYNGEIYNYRGIRKELVRLGYKFNSNSDTEVIIKAYEAWGIECLSKFRGMFAFALWDAKRKELLLVRDRIGVKPLYYYWNQGLLLFASELKALMANSGFQKTLNHKSLGLYLQLGYVPSPLSIFENTFKVQPGCYVKFTANGKVQETRYWEVTDFYTRSHSSASEDQVAEELRSILLEAFSYRMVSDVPVGIFLSGGIDSSLVTAVLAREANEKLQTFTVGFDDKEKDESKWASQIAQKLGTEHATLQCSEKEALNIVPELPQIYDEPFGDNSAIPTYLLCKAVRKHLKVALSGDGGDEFFCGYTTYTKFVPFWVRTSFLPRPVRSTLSLLIRILPPNLLENVPMLMTFAQYLFPQVDLSDFRDKATKFSDILAAPNFLQAYQYLVQKWPVRELNRLLLDPSWHDAFDPFAFCAAKVPLINQDYLSAMMAVDAKTFLPDCYLVKVDRASMAVGMEVREPMLDHKLIEYTAALPLRFKYFKGTSKYILRKILYDYLPHDLVDRAKRGFSVPLAEWMRGSLKPLVQEYLSTNRIRSEGIFDPMFVQWTLDDFLSEARIDLKKIWNLFVFELWYERWMRNSPS